MDCPSSSEQLVQHLIVVGPGRGIPFQRSLYGSSSKAKSSGSSLGSFSLGSSWHRVHRPVPTILRQYPVGSRGDVDLVYDVAYFCQPDGCCVSLLKPQHHIFLLTDTETNIRTYGVCLSLPHLFDPLLQQRTSSVALGEEVCDLRDPDDMCIQEWGVLSLCILSRHPFFSFYKHALQTLAHFVSDFCGEDLTWDAIIQGQCGAAENALGGSSTKQRAVSEVEQWIGNLLSLKAPIPGECALEVELEVDPAITICYPPPSRLPLVDLPIHEVFKKLGVCTVIEIYKLVLSEQKVVLHSKDYFFTSHTVLTILTLLYPIQYLFPVIPLLPSSMPTAENLLMVPTPFFIGVASSFLSKLHNAHLAEIWLIDLDSGESRPPLQADHELLEFPYCILQLQADIRRALDELDGAPSSSSRTATLESTVCSYISTEDERSRLKEGDVDVIIRLSFIDFLFSPEILGIIDQFLCIYRLFPRPVVTLRTTSFLHAYEKACPTTTTQFIKSLIRTQGIEYLFEWSLNPYNSAFEEIRRGVRDQDHVSDKQTYFLHRSGIAVHQVCLYDLNDDSILYQEMLTFKANQASYLLISPRDFPFEDDDSDFQYLAGEGMDDRSSLSDSSPTFFSDEDHRPWDSTHSSRRLLVAPQQEGAGQERLDIVGVFECPEEVEVDYHEPGRFVFPDPNSATPQSRVTDTGSIGPAALPAAHAQALNDESSDSSSLDASSLTESALYNRYRGLHPASSLGAARHASSYDALPTSDHLLQEEGEEEEDGEVVSKPGEKQKFLTPNSIEDAKFTFPDPLAPDTPPARPVAPKRRFFDDDLTVTRRRAAVSRESQHSWMNLTSLAAPSSDEFSTPPSSLRRSVSLRSRKREVATPPLPSRILPQASETRSHALDIQVSDLASKILDGQGLPWPKPPALKRIASLEKMRVLTLRLLETRLGVRRPSDLVLATSTQIRPVGVAKSVYKGLLDLLKFFLQAVEEELQKEPEAAIFSVFLIFRLAFTLYLLPRRSPHSIVTTKAVDQAPLALSIPMSVSLGGSNQSAPSSGRSSPRRLSLEITSGGPAEKEVGGASNGSQTENGSGVGSVGGVRKLEPEEGVKSESAVPVVKVVATDGSVITPRDSSGLSNRTEPHVSNPTATSTPNSKSSRNVLSTSRLQFHTPGPLGTEPIDIPETGDSQKTQRSPSPSSGGIPTPRASRSPYLLQLFHTPQEQKTSCFLYKDLMKGLGSGRAFMTSQSFWVVLFMSTLDVDRNFLGWNERTAELYERYNSLSESHRQAFGLEEDTLLSLILHSLLVYMLVVGLTTKETTSFIHRLTARARLAVMEERLLQQTLVHVEEKSSSEQQINLSDLGLVTLYSEVHPTTSYIVHYGVNMIAPVYKLQITNESLILRRFPDEKILSRLWNDCVVELSYNSRRETVSVKYRDKQGEFNHHFHSKQFMSVHNAMQVLVFGSHVDL